VRAHGKTAGVVAIAFVLGLAATAAAQVPPPEPPVDQSELVNTLLSGLLGFGDMTGPELQKEVGKVGGIAFREDVPLQYMNRAALSAYLKQLLDEEYPPARAAEDERTLVAFDLLPSGTDLRALRTRILEENIAGFYDERTGKKRLYVVSEEQRLTPANQLVLSHELRHALQDQYVDVGKVVPDTVGDFDDRRLAWMSVLEGDATLVMERFLLSRLPPELSGLEGLAGGGGGSELFGSVPVPPVPGAPPVVRDHLVLPYLIGRDFAHALWQGGGWDAVKAAWQKPPQSTEQILHPDKYLAGEEPQKVDGPSPPRGGRLLEEGVLGEMLTRTLLGEGAESAAAGWGGDLYRTFDLQGKTLLVWRSVWDTPADQKRFLETLMSRYTASHKREGTEDGAQVFVKGPWRVGIRLSAKGGVSLLASDDLTAFRQALGGER
jgi:hypothetical protein